MRFIEFSMHQGADGIIRLKDVLTVFPKNAWKWSILDLYGVGIAPGGMAMPDFESAVRSSSPPFTFGWPELLEFAAQLDQTYDCSLVAHDQTVDSVREKFSNSCYDEFSAVVQAMDSGKWSIGADEEILKRAEDFFL